MYALPHEERVLTILRAYGATRARLLGVAARNELTPTSDIDITCRVRKLIPVTKLSARVWMLRLSWNKNCTVQWILRYQLIRACGSISSQTLLSFPYENPVTLS